MQAENASHVDAWMVRRSVSEKAEAEESDVITGRGVVTDLNLKLEVDFNLVRNPIIESKLRKQNTIIRSDPLTYLQSNQPRTDFCQDLPVSISIGSSAYGVALRTPEPFQ